MRPEEADAVPPSLPAATAAAAGGDEELRFLFVADESLTVAVASHSFYLENECLHLLSASHTLGGVECLARGRASRRLGDLRGQRVGRPDDGVLWVGQILPGRACRLPPLLEPDALEVYVRRVLLGAVRSPADLLREECYQRAHRAETDVYRLLLKLDVDPAYHQHVYRLYLEEHEELVPEELTPEVEAGLRRAMRRLETAVGGPLSEPQKFEMDSRPLGPACACRPTAAAAADDDDPRPPDEDGPTLSPRRERGSAAYPLLMAEINRRLLLPQPTEDTGPALNLSLGPHMNFKQMVAHYALSAEQVPEAQSFRPPVPKTWGSDRMPFLLADDSALDTHRRMSYLAAFPRALSAIPPRALSEIFLPGQAFSVLTFDLDRSFGPDQREEAELLSDQFLRGEVGEDFLKTASRAGQLYLKRATGRGDCGAHLQQWGDLALYMRSEALPAKLSCRLVWRPPLEMCFPDVGHLKAFLEVFAQGLGDSSRFGRIYDLAPFATHKSCRLPNGQKYRQGRFCGTFKFMGLLNRTTLDGGDQRRHELMTAGLSRQKVDYGRDLLGEEAARAVLEKVWLGRSGGPAADRQLRLTHHVSPARTARVVAWLTAAWGGAPHLADMAGGGLRATPAQRGVTPCPLHGRVHKKSSFSLTVTEYGLYPHCFNANGTPPLAPGQYFCLEEPAAGEDAAGPLRLAVRAKRRRDRAEVFLGAVASGRPQT